MRVGLTTACPNRQVARTPTLSLSKYWCSLVAISTDPTADTMALRSMTRPE
jgi:hypothetical protein